MAATTSEPKFSMTVTAKVLVVSVQFELSDKAILELQHEILSNVYEKQVVGVILDVSGVDIIDSYLLRVLMDTSAMVRLLGSTAVITGIKPAIVASLVDFGGISSGVKVAMNIDQGMEMLTKA